jgi:hypothetical protein
MIPPGSRYEQAESNFTLSHLYSERGFPLLAGEIGMTNLRIRTALREASYMMTTQPEVAGTTMVYYAKETETFQFLGFKFLDDPKRWHEVANLNQQVWYPLDLKPGQIMRAPIS